MSESHKGIQAGENHPRYGKKHTNESRKKMSDAHKDKMCGENHPMYGKHHTDESKQKISESLKDRFCGDKNPFFGKKHSKETKEKISESHIGLHMGEKNHNYGKNFSEETRSKMSESHKGVQAGKNNPAWKGGVSFSEYCHKFNFRLKEQVREKFGRVCFICSKSEEDNGRRLDVHHVDGNKMQGCDDNEWFLVPLCRSCHSKIQHDGKKWNT